MSFFARIKFALGQFQQYRKWKGGYWELWSVESHGGGRFWFPTDAPQPESAITPRPPRMLRNLDTGRIRFLAYEYYGPASGDRNGGFAKQPD